MLAEIGDVPISARTDASVSVQINSEKRNLGVQINSEKRNLGDLRRLSHSWDSDWLDEIDSGRIDSESVGIPVEVSRHLRSCKDSDSVRRNSEGLRFQSEGLGNTSAGFLIPSEDSTKNLSVSLSTVCNRGGLGSLKDTPFTSLKSASTQTQSGGQKMTPFVSEELKTYFEGIVESQSTTRLPPDDVDCAGIPEGSYHASGGSLKAPDSKCSGKEASDSAKAPGEATGDKRVDDKPSGVKGGGAAPDLSRGSREVLNEIARKKRKRKAIKADDAVVPEFLWEEHLLQDCPTPWVVVERTRLQQGIVLLRTRMLKWWKRRVARSFLAWLKREYPALKEAETYHVAVVRYDGNRYVWTSGNGETGNLEGVRGYKQWWKERMLLANADLRPGADAVRRAAESSWWNWNDGSRPFHWRWPRWYQSTIRDGLKVHFQGKKPAYRKAQRCSPDEATRRKMREKLKAVRDRRYIAPGFVKSLTSFFSVPKGDDGVRMVYNGSESGLNDAIWVP
jgi:hypothetical protein